MTYIAKAANRRRHIAAAIRDLGGNRSAAAQLSRIVGQPLHENRIADWKRVGSVPLAWCGALAEATRGRFVPARVRPKWAEETTAGAAA